MTFLVIIVFESSMCYLQMCYIRDMSPLPFPPKGVLFFPSDLGGVLNVPAGTQLSGNAFRLTLTAAYADVLKQQQVTEYRRSHETKTKCSGNT